MRDCSTHRFCAAKLGREFCAAELSQNQYDGRSRDRRQRVLNKNEHLTGSAETSDMLPAITRILKAIGLIALPLAMALQLFAGISVGRMLAIALTGAACFYGAHYIERQQS